LAPRSDSMAGVQIRVSEDAGDREGGLAPGSPCGVSKKQQQQGASTEQGGLGTAARQLFSCKTPLQPQAASPDQPSVDSAPSTGTVMGVGNGAVQEAGAATVSNSSTSSKAPDSTAAAAARCATSNQTPFPSTGLASLDSATAAAQGLTLRSSGSSTLDLTSLAEPGAGLAPVKTSNTLPAPPAAAIGIKAFGKQPLSVARSTDGLGSRPAAAGVGAAGAPQGGLTPFHQAHLYQQYMQSAMQGNMGMSRALSAAAPLPPASARALPAALNRVASAPALMPKMPLQSRAQDASGAAAAGNLLAPLMGLGGKGQWGPAGPAAFGAPSDQGVNAAAVAAMAAAAGGGPPAGMTPALLALLRQPALMAANPLATAVMAATLGGPLGAAVALNSAAAAAAAASAPAAAASVVSNGSNAAPRAPGAAGAAAGEGDATRDLSTNNPILAAAIAAAGGMKGHPGTDNPMAAALKSLGRDHADCACVYCRLKRQRGVTSPPPLPPPPLILAGLTQQLNSNGSSSSARTPFGLPSAASTGRLPGPPAPLWNASSMPLLSGQQDLMLAQALAGCGPMAAAAGNVNAPAFFGGRGAAAWGGSAANAGPGSRAVLQPVLGLQLNRAPSPASQAAANKAMLGLGVGGSLGISLSNPASLPDQEQLGGMQLDLSGAAAVVAGAKADLMCGYLPQNYEALLAGFSTGHEGVHGGVCSPSSDISSGSLLAPPTFSPASAAAVGMAQ
jgi:hypothetical protein